MQIKITRTGVPERPAFEISTGDFLSYKRLRVKAVENALILLPRMTNPKWTAVLFDRMIEQNKDTPGFAGKFILAYYDALGDKGLYQEQAELVAFVEKAASS